MVATTVFTAPPKGKHTCSPGVVFSITREKSLYLFLYVVVTVHRLTQEPAPDWLILDCECRPVTIILYDISCTDTIRSVDTHKGDQTDTFNPCFHVFSFAAITVPL